MSKSNKLWLLLLSTSILLMTCQSINSSNAKLGVFPSYVILSFDDGPNVQDDTTARLLDVLKKYEIHALFSLLGENAEQNPELVRRIYDEGHYIINHGYFDKPAHRMGEEAFRENLTMGEKAISEALGKELNPKLYQPHGGFYNSRQERICREAGYTIVPSSVRVYDAVSTGAKQDKAVKRVMEKIEKQKGGIILLHDARDSYFRMEKKLGRNPSGAFNRSWIPDAVEKIIVILLERGYILNGDAKFITE